MLSRAATILLKKSATSTARTSKSLLKANAAPIGCRFYSLEEHPSAKSAWQKSCYFEMDFTIPEDATVYEAVQKFAAYDIGCLVTTDASGELGHSSWQFICGNSFTNSNLFVVFSILHEWLPYS